MSDKKTYKIISITNRNGVVRQESSAQKRIGQSGKILVLANDTSMVFLYEPESREIIGKDMMVTSHVLYHHTRENPNRILVATENSIYEFEEV